MQRSGISDEKRSTASEFVFEINHGFCLILNCDEDRTNLEIKKSLLNAFEVIKKG
jgi:hypothetical protein